jgi:hypothetical protein
MRNDLEVKRLRRPVSYSLAPDLIRAVTQLREIQRRSRSAVIEDLIMAGYRAITGTELRRDPRDVPAK